MLRIKMIEYQDYPKMHKCLNHNKKFQYIHYTDGSTDLLHTYVSNYKTRVSYCSCCSNNPAFKKIRQDTFGVPETGHPWCTRDRTRLVYPRQDTLGVPDVKSRSVLRILKRGQRARIAARFFSRFWILILMDSLEYSILIPHLNVIFLLVKSWVYKRIRQHCDWLSESGRFTEFSKHYYDAILYLQTKKRVMQQCKQIEN